MQEVNELSNQLKRADEELLMSQDMLAVAQRELEELKRKVRYLALSFNFQPNNFLFFLYPSV